MSDFSNRTLILSDSVDKNSVKNLIYNIISYNMLDDLMEQTQVGYSRQPIVLIVNSFGGSVYDGFGLVSAIEISATPVITVCLGSAMSMGLAIYLAGHKRIAHELSTFMYHEVRSGGGMSTLTEQKVSMEELDRIQLQYDMFVLSKTNITEAQIDEVKKKQQNWYLDAHQAAKLGIVDLVVDEPVYWNYADNEEE